MHKEDKNRFFVSINPIGKLLWQTQLGSGCLPAPLRPQLTPWLCSMSLIFIRVRRLACVRTHMPKPV